MTNIAKANTAANKEAFKVWVEAHTVEEIHKANGARRMLRRIAKQPLPEGRQQSYVNKNMSFRGIVDIRAPKRADNAFITYVRERFASGEFAGSSGPEAIKAISNSWKQFSTEEKQVSLSSSVSASSLRNKH